MKGKHKKDFTVTGLSRKTVAPGKSATFKVVFRPKAKGKKRKAVVVIQSNDEDESAFEIGLTGSGR